MRGLEKILLVTIGGVIIYLLWPKKARAEEIKEITDIKLPIMAPWIIETPALSWQWESMIKTDGQQAPSNLCSGVIFFRAPLPGEWCYRAN